MKIYTKTGDSGETGLLGGQRVSKNSVQINSYGECDELNSCIGLLSGFIKNDVPCSQLLEIQKSLFIIGSHLASSLEDAKKFKLPILNESEIKKLETEIDMMDQELPPLKRFILPGGSLAASQAHVCRTVCRRVERSIISFKQNSQREDLDHFIVYINRLSDYFFVFARFLNFKTKTTEVEWVPS